MNKEQKQKENKTITFRIAESLLNDLQVKTKKHGMSINGYISFLINSSLQKQEILFREVIGKPEKKGIKSNVYLTKSEVELLREYALENSWSLPKEIRYRIVSSLAKKPKLNKKELKAMYCVRSSINTLGANINCLIRNNQVLSKDNISICTELLSLIRELKDKINYLEQCTYSNFKLKEKKIEKNGS